MYEDYIIDDSKSHFYLVPNIVDDLELSVYAFRLYSHYKRVTGESGSCWQSVKTLSKVCKMSAGSITNARRELVDRELILVKEISNPTGKSFLEVRIVDIWNKNKAGCSPCEQRRSPHEQPYSPGEIKNTPLNKTTLKNNTSFEKTSKEEPILEPCNEDGVPDSWREVKTRKPTISENEQRLAQLIADSLGIKPPICNSKKEYAAAQVTWWKPIKEMLRQVDGDIEKAERIVDDVITTYRAAKLTMNSPKSLLNGFIGELVNHNKPRKAIGIDINGEEIYE
jgi:hypothetical protein